MYCKPAKLDMVDDSKRFSPLGAGIDMGGVTLGPGRYRHRLNGSKDCPKGCPLGFQASRQTPGFQRFQRGVDSIVRQRLREIRGKGQ